jgi:hypothetical protein
MYCFNAIVFALLASIVFARRTPSERLPVVDLGYELYRATEFNVGIVIDFMCRRTYLVPSSLGDTTTFPISDTLYLQ